MQILVHVSGQAANRFCKSTESPNKPIKAPWVMCPVLENPPLPRLLFEHNSVHFLWNENARLTPPNTSLNYENSQPIQYFGTRS